MIQEAQQAGVPVITADAGGMAELVVDGVNGLTFNHRSVPSLSAALIRAWKEPNTLAALGKRGFLHSPDGNIPALDHHIDAVLQLYQPASTFPWLVVSCMVSCKNCARLRHLHDLLGQASYI